MWHRPITSMSLYRWEALDVSRPIDFGLESPLCGFSHIEEQNTVLCITQITALGTPSMLELDN